MRRARARLGLKRGRRARRPPKRQQPRLAPQRGPGLAPRRSRPRPHPRSGARACSLQPRGAPPGVRGRRAAACAGVCVQARARPVVCCPPQHKCTPIPARTPHCHALKGHKALQQALIMVSSGPAGSVHTHGEGRGTWVQEGRGSVLAAPASLVHCARRRAGHTDSKKTSIVRAEPKKQAVCWAAVAVCWAARRPKPRGCRPRRCPAAAPRAARARSGCRRAPWR